MIERRAPESKPEASAVASPWFLRAVDLAFIVFMYLNVLAPKVTLAGLSVSKLAFTVSLGLFGVYSLLHPSRRRLTGAAFLATSAAMVTMLVMIGAIKGNRIEDILGFVSPLFMLVAVPLIQELSIRYGCERYIRHVVISSTLLAVYLLSIYMVKGPLRLPDEMLLVPEQPGFTSVSFPEGTPKVIAVTTGFFPAGLVGAYYLSAAVGQSRYYLPLLLIAGGVYIGQTMGIWSASVCALFMGALMIRSTSFVRAAILWTTIPTVVVVGIGSAITRGDILDPSRVFDTKSDSIDQKLMQTIEMFDVFMESPLFGRGLGYRYQLSEISSLSDNESVFVEASYSMILGSTGLLGAVFYGFIYFYHLFLYFARPVRHGPTTFAAISHCGILVASIGLPYLWSGGMGIFFLSFLIAWMHLPAHAVQPLTVVAGPMATPARANGQGWRRRAGSLPATG